MKFLKDPETSVGLHSWLSGKERTASAGDAGLIPRSGWSPWERKWQPTPVLLPGKSHGQRSLVGYSPRSHKSAGHDLVTKQQQALK